MSNTNEEAAVNALHVQHEYGDEDLKKDVERLIMRVVNQNLPTIAAQVIVNNAREIEKIVARYITNKLQGDRY